MTSTSQIRDREVLSAVRSKLNMLIAGGSEGWTAYRDFSVIADDVVIDANAYDALGNRFQAAAGSTPELFKVTGGAAWMGGRSRVATGNAYMALKAGPVSTVWAEFVLDRPDETVTDPDSSSLAIVLTNDELLTDLDNLLHPVITRNGWFLQLRTDGGTLTTVASGTWETPLIADGETRHQFALIVHPETNYILLLWPAKDASTGLDYRIVGSSSFGRVMGSLAYWQENRTNATKIKPGLTRIGLVTSQPALQPVEYLTATATLTKAYKFTLVRPAASGVVLTLPAANTAHGHERVISVPSTAAHSISVSGSFWDGDTSKTVAAGASLRIVADTVNNVWASY